MLALVVVLQSISSFGFIPICLCLIPITLGAMLLGWRGGLGLGFAFGVVALFWGMVGKDPFTALLFAENPGMTIVICLVKGSLCGLIPALVYKLIEPKNQLVASIVAAVLAPIVNTGVFILGSLIIQQDVMDASVILFKENKNIDPEAMGFTALLFLVLISANFFIEFGVNVVFAPALGKLVPHLIKHYSKKAPEQASEQVPKEKPLNEQTGEEPSKSENQNKQE